MDAAVKTHFTLSEGGQTKDSTFKRRIEDYCVRDVLRPFEYTGGVFCIYNGAPVSASCFIFHYEQK